MLSNDLFFLHFICFLYATGTDEVQIYILEGQFRLGSQRG